MSLKKLLEDIRDCNICKAHLPLDPNPVLAASTAARILIIGQAPGTKVHASGIPWNDASGRLLREWMELDESTFYNKKKIALIPMGFCFPGKGNGGDMPPRPECAPQWHISLLKYMKNVQLIVLIGQYSQRYYLGDTLMHNLTETVRNFRAYLPEYIPLPHPSPRNRIWLKKNSWFEKDLLPVFREKVDQALS
jgi:uracil-DNA glycosylase